MTQKHTNLRELIPKWRRGTVKRVQTDRGQLVRGDYIDLGGGTIGKIAYADCTGVHYWEVDLKGRGLCPSISTTNRPAFNVLHHKSGKGY